MRRWKSILIVLSWNINYLRGLKNIVCVYFCHIIQYALSQIPSMLNVNVNPFLLLWLIYWDLEFVFSRRFTFLPIFRELLGEIKSHGGAFHSCWYTNVLLSNRTISYLRKNGRNCMDALGLTITLHLFMSNWLYP